MDDLKLNRKSKDELKALIYTVRIFTDDEKIKFYISKCTTVVMKRERKVEDDGVDMLGGIDIGYRTDGACKYLRVLKSDKIKM